MFVVVQIVLDILNNINILKEKGTVVLIYIYRVIIDLTQDKRT